MQMNRWKRRAAALTLAAAMLLSGSALAAFSDTDGHWAEDAIDKWSGEYQIIGGYNDGTFRPDASITRGAFAGILDRFLKYQKSSPDTTFSDTKGTYWEDEILKLNAAGVYLGNGGKALAGNSITRQQAIAMIGRAFEIEESDTTPNYSDAQNISSYARGYVSAMQQAGYLEEQGSDEFRPTDPITRAEIINVLDNMISELYQQSKTYSENVTGTLMINATNGASLEDMTISGDLILAPGVLDSVTLTNVTIKGKLRNLSDITPTVVTEPEDPEQTETTQEYIIYNGSKIPVAQGVPVNTFKSSDFAKNSSNWLSYYGTDYKTRLGVDVSAYQNRANTTDQTIDWTAVADSGIEFAFVRVGLRGYSTGSVMADAFYKQNVDGAMAAGLDTGVYFFSQAITVEEAIEEADFVIDALKGHKISGPVAYDWEMSDSSYRVYGTPPEVATACAKAFCDRIEAAGYDAIIYSSKYVNYLKYDLTQLYGYGLWYPEYSGCPSLYYAMDYWQYTDSGKVPGISGRVDMNVQFIR